MRISGTPIDRNALKTSNWFWDLQDRARVNYSIHLNVVYIFIELLSTKYNHYKVCIFNAFYCAKKNWWAENGFCALLKFVKSEIANFCSLRWLYWTRRWKHRFHTGSTFFNVNIRAETDDERIFPFRKEISVDRERKNYLLRVSVNLPVNWRAALLFATLR